MKKFNKNKMIVHLETRVASISRNSKIYSTLVKKIMIISNQISNRIKIIDHKKINSTNNNIKMSKGTLKMNMMIPKHMKICKEWKDN